MELLYAFVAIVGFIGPVGDDALHREVVVALDHSFGRRERPVRDQSSRGCEDPACAARMVRTAGVEYALIVELRGEEDLEEIALLLVDRAVNVYPGRASVTDGVDAAVEVAVTAALAHVEAGPGPWLRVPGPMGATVYVDGEEVGVAPYVGAVRPGEREVSVEAPGGDGRRTQCVEVPFDQGHETLVVFAPEVAPPLAPRGPRFRRRVGAALLGATSATLTAASIGVVVGGGGQRGARALGVLGGVAALGALGVGLAARRAPEHEVTIGAGVVGYRLTF